MNKFGNINEKETLNSLENLSDEELVSLKNQALLDEDYDKAKEIKQEQERRKEVKEVEKKAGKTLKIKEETDKKESDIKEVLLNDKAFKKIVGIMEGVVKHIERSNLAVAESNSSLGKRTKELNGELGLFIDQYKASNRNLSWNIQELKKSIDGLVQKLGENNNPY